MVWQRLSELIGPKSSSTETVSRGPSIQRQSVIAAIFENKTLMITDRSRFELCHFVQCKFLLDEAGVSQDTKIFLNCNFDGCDFGMPRDDFLAFTQAAVVNVAIQSRVTLRQAIDEAVRRYYRQRPTRTALCLDPSNQSEREELAEWVRAEYRKIIAEHAKSK
jgi:hypothetical protein